MRHVLGTFPTCWSRLFLPSSHSQSAAAGVTCKKLPRRCPVFPRELVLRIDVVEMQMGQESRLLVVTQVLNGIGLTWHSSQLFPVFVDRFKIMLPSLGWSSCRWRLFDLVLYFIAFCRSGRNVGNNKDLIFHINCFVLFCFVILLHGKSWTN